MTVSFKTQVTRKVWLHSALFPPLKRHFRIVRWICWRKASSTWSTSKSTTATVKTIPERVSRSFGRTQTRAEISIRQTWDPFFRLCVILIKYLLEILAKPECYPHTIQLGFSLRLRTSTWLFAELNLILLKRIYDPMTFKCAIHHLGHSVSEVCQIKPVGMLQPTFLFFFKCFLFRSQFLRNFIRKE